MLEAERCLDASISEWLVCIDGRESAIPLYDSAFRASDFLGVALQWVSPIDVFYQLGELLDPCVSEPRPTTANLVM